MGMKQNFSQIKKRNLSALRKQIKIRVQSNCSTICISKNTQNGLIEFCGDNESLKIVFSDKYLMDKIENVMNSSTQTKLHYVQSNTDNCLPRLSHPFGTSEFKQNLDKNLRKNIKSTQF